MMKTRTPVATTVLALLLGSAGSAVAQIPLPLNISGNQATATISLPGGIGAELTITFENAVGLNSSSLAATIKLVNPLELLGRLPSLASLPGSYPVLLLVGPTPGSGLSYSGLYTVSLYTHNLNLNPLVPLSLFKGPNGGVFKDITVYEGIGSYRCSGSDGSFSEFLILVDLRNINNVINGKFNTLQSTLTANAGSMPAPVFDALQTLLSDALALYQGGSTTAAADTIG